MKSIAGLASEVSAMCETTFNQTKKPTADNMYHTVTGFQKQNTNMISKEIILVHTGNLLFTLVIRRDRTGFARLLVGLRHRPHVCEGTETEWFAAKTKLRCFCRIAESLLAMMKQTKGDVEVVGASARNVHCNPTIRQRCFL